ncbi:MAG: hypothetical protein V4683_15245 [Bacteroidota bacterium]
MKIIYSAVLFFVIALIIYILQNFGYNHLIHANIWIIFVFFLAVAFLNYQLMKMAFEKNREKFITFFMASVVIRLILSLLFLGAFIFIKLENVQLFAINFFALYLCVLVFEIFENSRNLRQN